MCTTNKATPQQSIATAEVTCEVWYNLIYVPFVQGQFGWDANNLPAYAFTDPMTPAGSSYVEVGKGDTGDGAKDLQGVQKSGDNRNIEFFEGSNGYSEHYTNAGQTDYKQGTLEVNKTTTPALANWAYYQMASSANQTKGAGGNMSEVAYNQLVINHKDFRLGQFGQSCPA